MRKSTKDFIIQVVPLTSKKDCLYPKAMRLFKRAGVLSEEDMLWIGEAIKIQLDIY
jgi:hypothetical protein